MPVDCKVHAGEDEACALHRQGVKVATPVSCNLGGRIYNDQREARGRITEPFEPGGIMTDFRRWLQLDCKSS